MFATASTALAGTIAPKNIARLRTLDARTLAVFSSTIRSAEAALGELPAVGMHAAIDGRSPRTLAEAWAARDDRRFFDRAVTRIRSAAAILVDERNNAPFDFEQLDALIDAYALVRSNVEATDRATIDRALDRTARGLLSTAGRGLDPQRIDSIGRIGLLVDDADLVGEAMASFIDYVDAHLRADGSTDRAVDRDGVGAQVDQIEPLVDLALAADRNGRRLYASANDRGASLATAVGYLERYARFGANWDPRRAQRMFALASHFDPRYDDLRVNGTTIGETATALLARLDR